MSEVQVHAKGHGGAEAARQKTVWQNQGRPNFLCGRENKDK